LDDLPDKDNSEENASRKQALERLMDLIQRLKPLDR
jgi:hypothetical protein